MNPNPDPDLERRPRKRAPIKIWSSFKSEQIEQLIAGGRSSCSSDQLPSGHMEGLGQGQGHAAAAVTSAAPAFGFGPTPMSRLSSGIIGNTGIGIPPNQGFGFSPFIGAGSGGAGQLPNMTKLPFGRPMLAAAAAGEGLAEVLGVGGPTFGPSGDYTPPPIFNSTEFPNLPQVGLGLGFGSGRHPQAEHTPFTMSSEDFPALPTPRTTMAPIGTAPSSSSAGKAFSQQGNGNADADGAKANCFGSDRGIEARPQPVQRGIRTYPEGRVTNIPGSMLNDQFGITGLLTFIRAAESNPSLVELALGRDLTSLGLNLSGPESLYPSFGGPLSEGPVRVEDIDYPVPEEYNIGSVERLGLEFVASMRGKMSPLKMSHYKDDLLFYIFYTYTGDALQLHAAAQLYNRDWRYHMVKKMWLSRSPNFQPTEKGVTCERGTYYTFDPISWTKKPKELFLEYDKLEGRPVIPPQFLHLVE